MTSADRDYLNVWVGRLCTMFPHALAILMRGSQARNDAGMFSDIDFDVLVSGETFESYPMFLERDDSGTIRHISVAVQDLNSWLADEDEPGDWSFGLGTRTVVKLLWSRDPETAALFDTPWRRHPPAEPELEDFIEGYGKVLNAWHLGDALGMRQAAHNTAKLAPGLLRLVNAEVWPGTRREALDAALGFVHAPAGYRDAMLRCLGLHDVAGSPGDLVASARLLAEGVTSLLRESGQFGGTYPEGEPFGLLANGAMAAYLDQMWKSAETWKRDAGNRETGR